MITDKQRYDFMRSLTPDEHRQLFVLGLEGMKIDKIVDDLISSGKRVTIIGKVSEVAEIIMTNEQIKRFQHMMSLKSPTMQLLADYAIHATSKLNTNDMHAVDVGTLEFLMSMIDKTDNQDVAFKDDETIDIYYGLLYFCLERVLRGGFASNIKKSSQLKSTKARLDA